MLKIFETVFRGADIQASASTNRNFLCRCLFGHYGTILSWRVPFPVLWPSWSQISGKFKRSHKLQYHLNSFPELGLFQWRQVRGKPGSCVSTNPGRMKKPTE